MTATLAHRGPDGEGVRCFPSSNGGPPASLGHRRLTIIDLSERGAQPMEYANGRYWITYNGELYNFRELRERLEGKGDRFRSECDTEVLLAAYARYGPAMLDHLNGIFAFAIWDCERHELFVARDRLGVKPVYYLEHDGTFFFASEIKALLAAVPAPRLRPEAIADYLTFLWIPDPETLFDGVLKLPPGHFAIFGSGGLHIQQYWDVTFDVDDSRSNSEWVTTVEQQFREAVQRQMIADVPLGGFLSGGIDSSAIVAAMTGVANDVTTYAIGFQPEYLRHDIAPDDLPYARRVAEVFGVDYHEQVLEPEIVDLLPRLVYHLDDPVADPAAVTTYLICAAAAERLKVILSGMGGDEVFAGYPRYLASRIARVADIVPSPARRRARQLLEGRITMGRPGRLRGPRRNLLKLLRGIDAPPHERYLTYSSYYRTQELEALLSGELRAELGEHDPFRYHRLYFDRMRDKPWLNQLLYVDAKTYLPCLNLAYTDKMGMAASTEVRVPFLDDQFFAHAARIPPQLKLRGLTRKWVFKQSMEGVLPREVIWRRKAGFGAPIRGWVNNDLRPMIDDLLSPATVTGRGLFDPGEVERLISAGRAGTEDNAFRLWALLTLELWQRTFVDAGPAASSIEKGG